MDFLRQLFLSGDFQPHGFCCQPSSGLVWLNVLSDAFIALAYFTILFALRWLIRKQRRLSFRWMFLGLALFMVASLEAQTTSIVEGIVTDQQGLAVAGAAIQIGNPLTGIDRGALSAADGAYRIPGLPAGTYVVTTSRSGFSTEALRNLELSVNRTLVLNIVLNVGGQTERIEVSGATPLLETATSSTGATILPVEINQMPINGRNYLDLLQLVPGVAINRQQDPSLDSATPILGERGGSAVFLIDGMPNEDEVNGGAASQFNQDSILEFQVITGGYKAEFGHASGGVINVLSRSGTNDWHGGASFFHRNYKLDSSDSPLVLAGKAPFVLGYDSSAQAGGPVMKNKVFLFGSAERILESRQLNFQFPQNTPPILIQLETPFNLHTHTFDTRMRAKLDEQWGHHRLSQQFNLTNTHVTDFLSLLEAINLPSTRNNLDSRRLMLGFSDTATLGNQQNPLLIGLYAQYRGEPSDVRPAHPEAGSASTLANLFSSLDTGGLFGDQPQVRFGAGHTALFLHQKYLSLGANLAKQAGRHGWKWGWDFQRTHVQGTEASNLFSQSFTTSADLQSFGAVNSGVYFLNAQGGLTPQDNVIALANNYNGAFVQDDWKFSRNVTLNLGLRWDYDNRFPNKTNFSPRLGFAWSITPKTVLRASWGLFYDHFRLGLARDIPGFGGANLVTQTFLSFPRLFYGDPSTLTILFASLGLPVPCASANLTDAQIQSTGAQCSAKSPSGTNQPLYGTDHLNSVVAPGHAPVPANAVVNLKNVQALTGFTPQQFADAASASVGAAPGSFSYDPFGNLTIGSKAFPVSGIPIAVDPGFKTPYTNGFYAGLQRQLSSDTVVRLDYYHKSINNILGVRDTNLAFEARIAGHTGETVPAGSPLVFSYGPWLHGTYDAAALGFTKRMSRSFTLDANYTWTHETDNALNSSFVSDLQTNLGAGFAAATGPTDSFVGMTTVVTDPVTGQTNANGPFTASNGNPIPKAGIYFNGPNLDKGPSDLALNHTFLVDGLVQLPWNTDFSAIFRAQSGFHYSAAFAANPPDVDGDGHFNGIDFIQGRNHFVAPPFVNLDVRIAKRFDFGERVKLHATIEFFNLFNRGNPAAVNGLPPGSTNSTAPAFGAVLQVLPGREGQAGLRIEF
jgi:outer membrane receptor protein involved in Fe transport